MSPISSSSSVPPSACSNRPRRRTLAPVKAPRSWPNSSLSSSASGMAAQLTATNRPLRAEARCSARATRSLPAPVSPWISTTASVGPTRATSWRSSSSLGLSPTRLPGTASARRSSSPSSRRRCSARALRMLVSRRSGDGGFSTKSAAPRLQRGDGVGGRGLARQHHHRQRQRPGQPLQQRQPALARHAQIQQQQVGRAARGRQPGLGLGARPARQHGHVALVAQHAPHAAQDGGIVVARPGSAVSVAHVAAPAPATFAPDAPAARPRPGCPCPSAGARRSRPPWS